MSHQAIAAFNFFKGHPSVDLLPNRQILEASTRVLQRFEGTEAGYDGLHNRHPLTYGPDMGNEDVRELIARWNDRKFGLSSATDVGCLNLTSGASYGVMNILAQFTSPHNFLTRRAFLVSPTYFLINAAFIDAGFGEKLSAVEEFGDGQIDFDGLEAQLKHYDSLAPIKETITADDVRDIHDPDRPLRRIYRYVIYLVPTFSNPRGGTLSQENRLRLVELARQYNMLIICDDVYDLLIFNGPNESSDPEPAPSKRIVYIDRETLPDGDQFGHTISNATFSKILGPGLRVGFQETPTPELAFRLSQGGAHKSGGTPGHFNTVIVGELLRSGEIDRIVANLRLVYSERARVLVTALHEHLPAGTEIGPLDGGYFVWVTLPKEYPVMAIAERCRLRGVVLATGDNFEVTGDELDWGKSAIRLSVSHLSASEIEEGIKIWGEICREMV